MMDPTGILGRMVGRSLCASCLVATVVTAQQGAVDEVELRVASSRPNGYLVVDRGKRDLVQVGDRVVLTLRNGQVVQAVVREVDERTSTIEPLGQGIAVPLGSKGRVLVPQERRAAQQPKPKPEEPTAPPVDDAPPRAQQQPEDDWRPGMPLLGNTRPLHAVDRSPAIHGRYYAVADVVSTLGDLSHSFLRTGVDGTATNLFADGGTFNFHGEFGWLEETSGNTGTDLRIFDLSYERGGNRFEPLHWQVGRFLVRDMPEFGLLDGGSVDYRREGGDRFGASLGYLPNLDEDLDTLANLQIAAWYTWISDVSERFTVTLGFQKTWRRLDADRDLIVVKSRYLPFGGWNTTAVVWLDLYDNRDVGKSAASATRANASLGREWQGSGGITLAYDHEEYPALLRPELPQTILPTTLLDAHQDRLTGAAHWFLGGGGRVDARVTGWIDEERQGGSGDLGYSAEGWLQEGARTGLALYDVQGLTNTVVGVRAEHGKPLAGGRLDVLYELGFVHHEGFPADRNDLLQHRLAGLWSSDLGANWTGLVHTDATLYDQELSFSLGIYLQRHF